MRLLLLAFAAVFATSLTSCFISPLPPSNEDQDADSTAVEIVVDDTISDTTSDTVNEVQAFGSVSDSTTTGD